MSLHNPIHPTVRNRQHNRRHASRDWTQSRHCRPWLEALEAREVPTLSAFQQGVAGYTGTHDTQISAGNVDTTGGSLTTVSVAGPGSDALLTVGDVTLDADEHAVTVAGLPVNLPLKEFELLHLLLANAGRVLPRETLIDRVWGSDYVGDTKTLDVHIKRLRAKIEPDPASPVHIITVRGLGYKFEPA